MEVELGEGYVSDVLICVTVGGQAGVFFSSARNAATTVQQERAEENGSSIEEAIDRPLLQEQVQCASLAVAYVRWLLNGVVCWCCDVWIWLVFVR